MYDVNSIHVSILNGCDKLTNWILYRDWVFECDPDREEAPLSIALNVCVCARAGKFHRTNKNPNNGVSVRLRLLIFKLIFKTSFICKTKWFPIKTNQAVKMFGKIYINSTLIGFYFSRKWFIEWDYFKSFNNNNNKKWIEGVEALTSWSSPRQTLHN